MPLLLHLIGRLAAVVLVCLAAAVVFITIDAHRSIDAEAAASADRVAERLGNLYWQKLLWRAGLSRETLVPMPEWQTLATMSLVAPGICVSFVAAGEAPHQLCSQTEALGPPAPAWFAAVSDAVFGPHAPVARPLSVRDRQMAAVITAAAPDAALRLAWHQVATVAGIATAMALGIAVLAAMMIGHALIPARTIIDGLRKLQRGDLAPRLPAFRTAEFNLIARAVNDLSAALRNADAARAALTARLFEVQEQERRALARDLHDEFGQCLTATAALAASIEAGAGPQRPDLAEEARAIVRIQQQMIANLRSALARLRSQDVDEIGLEASLRQLVRDHNMRASRTTVFRLDTPDLFAVPREIAIDVYRIAQECLTNAVRHGRPSQVKLRLEHAQRAPVPERGSMEPGPQAGDAIIVTVEDDGGGDAVAIGEGPGYGIVGIRERVAARGGSLSIVRAACGVRLSAVIPLIAPQSALAGASS